MPYEVPQFIEIEDKIFGPLTFKQFLYLGGGIGLSYVAWVLVPRIVAVLLVVLIGGFATALAFYKVNDRPFISMLENMFRYFLQPKLYVWKKEEPKLNAKAREEQVAASYVPKLSESKLHDLSWGLDVQASIYSEMDQRAKAKEGKVLKSDKSFGKDYHKNIYGG